MISVLATGKIIVAPTQRTGSSGKEFTTVTLACPANGDDVSVSVICFGATAQQQLLALSKGDTISVVGKAQPKIYTAKTGEQRPSLDVVAEQVMSAYQLKTKRAKAQAEPGSEPEPPQQSPQQSDDGELRDDIPW
jgi:single-stranded DNA-binding protein